MNKESSIKTDIREHKRKKHLGNDSPSCLLCGVTALECLETMKVERLRELGIPSGLLEQHHVAGKAHDRNLTVPLCANCHALQTEKLRQANVSMQPVADTKTRIATCLRAVAIFLMDLAASHVAWAKQLTEDDYDGQ